MQPGAVRHLVCAVALCTFSACAPAIGDECKTSLDCSSQGSRLCDRTQPHGYCTLRGCENGTCPEDSVCVKFRPVQERLATTYCMAKCEDDGDCRSDEGYRCSTASEFGETAELEAEILGRGNQGFCSAEAVMSLPPVEDTPDAGSGEPERDASVAGDDAGSDASAGGDDAGSD